MLAARGLALSALGGVGVSAYLTILHLTGTAPPCGSGGCATVQASGYAELLGLPVALYGAAAFGSLLALSLINRGWAAALAFVVALGSFVFVLYLKYVELFVLQAICRWCLAAALAALACLVLTSWRFYRNVLSRTIDPPVTKLHFLPLTALLAGILAFGGPASDGAIAQPVATVASSQFPCRMVHPIRPNRFDWSPSTQKVVGLGILHYCRTSGTIEVCLRFERSGSAPGTLKCERSRFRAKKNVRLQTIGTWDDGGNNCRTLFTSVRVSAGGRDIEKTSIKREICLRTPNAVDVEP